MLLGEPVGEPVGNPRLRRNATLLFCLQAADTAQKLSTVLFQCLFFKKQDPQTDPCCTADAIIYSIKNDGVLVFVPESVSSRRSQEPLEWCRTPAGCSGSTSNHVGGSAVRPSAPPTGTASKGRCT